MADDEWLEHCGKRGWIVFSHDRKFHHIDVEAAAIRDHGVAAFCLWGASDDTWEKLGHFVKAYPKIRHIVNSETPPYLYRITKRSRIIRVDL